MVATTMALAIALGTAMVDTVAMEVCHFKLPFLNIFLKNHFKPKNYLTNILFAPPLLLFPQNNLKFLSLKNCPDVYQMEVTEVYNHTMAMATTIMVDNGILALATTAAPIHTVSCHRVKRITIRAPDIEDTIDYKKLNFRSKKQFVNTVNK